MGQEQIIRLVVPQNNGDTSAQSRAEPLAGYPDVMTPAEVAEALQVSRSHVYELCAEGKLPSVKVGFSRRIPKHLLVQWLEGKL